MGERGGNLGFSIEDLGSGPLVKRAVFLDRDVVINRAMVRDGKPYPPASVAEFELLPGVVEACAELKAAGFLLVVATNQPDVGRGTQRREEVEAMHAAMCAALPVDRVEVCYDPGQGQPSEFRKPAPGMLLRAARELGMPIRWEGEGVDEKGYNDKNQCIVAVDPRYFRPTEVETLLGDATKARVKLGWTPQTTFSELVAEMVREDLKSSERDELIKDHGFKPMDRHE